MNKKLIITLFIYCLCGNLRKVDQQKFGLDFSDKKGFFRDLTNNEIINYYKTLSYKKGLQKEEFLIYLQEVISNGHKKIPHEDAWKTNWQYFTLLDRDWENDPLTEEEIKNTNLTNVGWKTTNVICLPLYTDSLTFINGTATLVDREHIWPKSRGFKFKDNNDKNKNEQPYTATDMHNLYMGDRKNNQNGHNNLPFGNVVDKEKAKKIESSTTGEITGYVGKNKYGITVYEPRDKDKGNIARALFYMATRYHIFKSIDDYEPSLKLITKFIDDKEATKTINVNDTKIEPATYGVIEDLLEWNKIDPVDVHEKHRNNLCYNIVQGNRNPYIDFPQWADIAFGESSKRIDLVNSDGIEIETNQNSSGTNNNFKIMIIIIILFSFPIF